MKLIAVVVHGALGKMGREITAAVCRDSDLKIVGAVDVQATQDYLELPDSSGRVPLSSDLAELLKICQPQVLIDFTIVDAALSAAKVAAKQGINLVTGTTGFSDENLREIDQLFKQNKLGVVVAPNFALGAVIMLHLARIASRFFDHAEIIELHHDQKADAPSGTALATAKAMIQSRGKSFEYASAKKENISGTRGGQVNGIAIHSVRLPGFVASQEVILGGQGQRLSLRHDTIGRECFMPGVLLATKEVFKYQGLVNGLDQLLHLGGDNESV